MRLSAVKRLLPKANLRSDDLESRSSGNGSLDKRHRLLPEAMFLRALCLERKRVERSRKSFVLMLLDSEKPLPKGHEDNVLERAVSGVFASIRETDIAGWYKEHSALGVIFAELGAADRESILSALRAKITAAMRSKLPAEELNRVRISFHCFPDDWDNQETRLPTIAQLYPDLMQLDAAQRVSRLIKRAIDIVGSSMALIVLSPILLAIACAIKLFSPGPILFRQKRIRQYGVTFTMLKFRSMRSGSDSQVHRNYVKRFIVGDVDPDVRQEPGKAIYKITDDPRVTRVGRFLRRTSLDELPQFLNVLRGEMSLVGPRPPIQYELEAYDIWHRRRVLEVKPGITGFWQVNGRSGLRFDDMVRLDLRYAKAFSLWLDIKILLRTPRAAFSGKGAY